MQIVVNCDSSKVCSPLPSVAIMGFVDADKNAEYSCIHPTFLHPISQKSLKLRVRNKNYNRQIHFHGQSVYFSDQ